MPEIKKSIASFTCIDKCMRWIDKNATDMLNGGINPWVKLGYGDEERSIEMNAKFHAMIGDISNQAIFKTPALTVKMSNYSIDEVKALLVAWFESDCILNLEPLRHGSKTIKDPFSGKEITIRASTKNFIKSEASNFIEWLYSTGVDGGVKWSEPAIKEYESYKDSQQ